MGTITVFNDDFLYEENDPVFLEKYFLDLLKGDE